MDSFAGAADDIVAVFWPDQRDRLFELRAHAQPRLVVVAGDASPPDPTDDLEEWVRLPHERLDLGARVQALARRVSHRPVPAPWIDDDGGLHTRTGIVRLPPAESALARAFLQSFDSVVPTSRLREILAAAMRDPKFIPGYIRRLRRHVASLGLTITTVPRRGYAMAWASG